MKAFTLLAFAASAVAQIPGLPSCAQTCVKLPASCQTTDFKCICSDKDFISTISCCVATSCQGGDQDTVIKFAQGICGSYGVTVPSQATCASGAASATTASSGSASNASPSLTAFVLNGTLTTTATVSVTDTVVTTTTTSASVTARTGAAANFAPQAGVVLGGVMAGMAVL